MQAKSKVRNGLVWCSDAGKLHIIKLIKLKFKPQTMPWLHFTFKSFIINLSACLRKQVYFHQIITLCQRVMTGSFQFICGCITNFRGHHFDILFMIVVCIQQVQVFDSNTSITVTMFCVCGKQNIDQNS